MVNFENRDFSLFEQSLLMEISDKNSIESKFDPIIAEFGFIRLVFEKDGGKGVVALRRLSGDNLDVTFEKLIGKWPENGKFIKVEESLEKNQGKKPLFNLDVPTYVWEVPNFKDLKFKKLGDLFPYWKEIFAPLIDYDFSNFCERNPFKEIVFGEPEDFDIRNAERVINNRKLVMEILNLYENNQNEEINNKAVIKNGKNETESNGQGIDMNQVPGPGNKETVKTSDLQQRREQWIKDIELLAELSFKRLEENRPGWTGQVRECELLELYLCRDNANPDQLVKGSPHHTGKIVLLTARRHSGDELDSRYKLPINLDYRLRVSKDGTLWGTFATLLKKNIPASLIHWNDGRFQAELDNLIAKLAEGETIRDFPKFLRERFEPLINVEIPGKGKPFYKIVTLNEKVYLSDLWDALDFLKNGNFELVLNPEPDNKADFRATPPRQPLFADIFVKSKPYDLLITLNETGFLPRDFFLKELASQYLRDNEKPAEWETKELIFKYCQRIAYDEPGIKKAKGQFYEAVITAVQSKTEIDKLHIVEKKWEQLKDFMNDKDLIGRVRDVLSSEAQSKAEGGRNKEDNKTKIILSEIKCASCPKMFSPRNRQQIYCLECGSPAQRTKRSKFKKR